MFSEPSLKPLSQLRQAVAVAVRQLQHVSPQVGGFFGGFLVEFGPCDLGLRWMVRHFGRVS